MGGYEITGNKGILTNTVYRKSTYEHVLLKCHYMCSLMSHSGVQYLTWVKVVCVCITF